MLFVQADGGRRRRGWWQQCLPRPPPPQSLWEQNPRNPSPAAPTTMSPRVPGGRRDGSFLPHLRRKGQLPGPPAVGQHWHTGVAVNSPCCCQGGICCSEKQCYTHTQILDSIGEEFFSLSSTFFFWGMKLKSSFRPSNIFLLLLLSWDPHIKKNLAPLH